MNKPSHPQLDLTSKDRAATRLLDSPGPHPQPTDTAISSYGLPYFISCAAAAKAKTVLGNCGKENGKGCCGTAPCHCNGVEPTPQTPRREAPEQD